MALRQDLTCVDQGATYRATLTFKDDNGVPLDLTGCSAEMQIRQMRGSTAYVTLTSASSGGLILGGAQGSIQITLTALQTASLPLNSEYFASSAFPSQTILAYDILVTVPSGQVVRYAEGAVYVSAAVTMPGVP